MRKGLVGSGASPITSLRCDSVLDNADDVIQMTVDEHSGILSRLKIQRAVFWKRFRKES
jgi:hypothetical protein